MNDKLLEEDEASLSVFKKKLKKLKEFKGRGTELISLYIPENADRSQVMGQLTEEMSQSSNIKSAITRKNVQGALRRISNFLKQIDFKIPKNGLVVFSGNVSEKEGASDIRLYTVRPISKLKTKLYWCDSSFHLDPLEEMVKPTDVFGILVIDKKEATIALLVGKQYEVLGKFTSGVFGKFRAGGQSAHRFEQLREEAEKEFYKRVSEKMGDAFLSMGDKLKGIIVAGPGYSKNDFLEREALDYRLKQKIIGVLDIGYTDESGIKEVIQRSSEILKNAEIVREQKIVNEFVEQVAKNGLAVFGQKETEEALMLGKARVLLVSEGIDWIVARIKCEKCEAEEEHVITNSLNWKPSEEKCLNCGSTKVEVLEEEEYIEYLTEKAHSIGAETHVISTETQEGKQFYKSFSGIGALLRYK